MNPAISRSRADVQTCGGLLFKVFFSKTQKVHLIFEIPKSTSINVSSHNMEPEYYIWNEPSHQYRRTDVSKIRGQVFLSVFPKIKK